MSTGDGLFARVRAFGKVVWDPDRQSAEFRRDIANWDQIYVGRKLSRWMTYCIRNSPLTPNHVTALWVSVAVAGACLLGFGERWASLTAIVLLYMAWLLDHVDGELARYRQQFSQAGNLMDMIGHEIVFPVVFCALTYAEVAAGSEPYMVIVGMAAAVLATPFTKMQENVKLLLCLRALAQAQATPAAPVDEQSDELPPRTLKELAVDIASVVFSQTGMMYLLVVAVLCQVESDYLVFYGVGLPVLFIPKYRARARELTRMAADPQRVRTLVRPEWLDG